MAGPAGASCPHGAGSVRSAPFRPYPGAPRRARRNRPQRRCRKGGGGQAAPAPAVWLPLEALRGLAGPGRDADGAIRAVGAGGSEAPELRREPAAGAGSRRGDGGAAGEADGGRGAEGGGTTVRRGRGGSAGGGAEWLWPAAAAAAAGSVLFSVCRCWRRLRSVPGKQVTGPAGRPRAPPQ